VQSGDVTAGADSARAGREGEREGGGEWWTRGTSSHMHPCTLLAQLEICE